MVRRASSNVWNVCCQTHSSLRLRKKRSMMPFCSGVYGRDELLLQARVPTGLPKAPALEDQPIVTAEDRGTDGPECPEALETGRFDRSLRLLRSTPEGKLVADEFHVRGWHARRRLAGG